jgi:hypothetical protein
VFLVVDTDLQITKGEYSIMKVIRLAGLAIVAVLVVSLSVASTASAGVYLFSPGSVGATFVGLSLAGTLRAGADSISCKDDVNAGTIANVHLLGPFDIKFTSCTASGTGGENCSAKSPGAAEGEILTHTVHALLGLVLPAVGLGLGGLLVLPVSGKQFVTIEETTCTGIATTITGSVAGLLEDNQGGHLILEALVLFIPNDIKKIDTLNGLVEPALTAFSEEATLETVEHLTFNRDVLVEVP